MKQFLWILNCWLVVLFILVSGVVYLLRHEPPSPPKRAEKEFAASPAQRTAPSINLEKIYQNDLFGTYRESDHAPEKDNLVTPIPAMQQPTITQPPAIRKPEFLPPMNITLKGIIVSSDDNKSIAMIADETKREGIYHIGDKLQDAQVLKIARNRVVLLRSNGQQEVYHLRGEDAKLGAKPTKPYELAVSTEDGITFEVDPEELKKEIDSLGEFIEMLGLRTTFEGGKPVGIQVGTVDPHEVGSVLGLEKNDIITTINGITTDQQRNRLEIYDTVAALSYGGTVTVELTRGGSPQTLTYELKRLERPLEAIFGLSNGDQQKEEKKGLPMSSHQQREQAVRQFQQQHDPLPQEQMILDLRRRLLENMRERADDVRIR